MSKVDGGPAFPAVIPIEHSDTQGKDYPNYHESGMTLRDWFAGQSLAGMEKLNGTSTSEQRAMMAYPGRRRDARRA